MATIPHRELRNHSSEILRRVAAGETIEVTNHGEVAAVLVPPAGAPLDRLARAGATRPARARGGFSHITRVSGESSERILDDLRGDR